LELVFDHFLKCFVLDGGNAPAILFAANGANETECSAHFAGHLSARNERGFVYPVLRDGKLAVHSVKGEAWCMSNGTGLQISNRKS
jgi:hypothetical protein